MRSFRGPSEVCFFPVLGLQTIISPSASAEASQQPSGEKATDVISAPCPLRLWPGAYVSVLQSSTVLPAPPVAINLPSGEKATAFTVVGWSSVVLRKLGMVQIFTVSPPAE